jgi:hypothetical protein
LEVALAEEPTQGEWKIKTTRLEVETTQTFIVDEYGMILCLKLRTSFKILDWRNIYNYLAV